MDKELKIFKYKLEIVDEQIIHIHQHMDILSVQVQDGYLCFWALVETDSVIIDLPIVIIGTGNLIDYVIEKHIGTCQLNGFVWHVFIGEQQRTKN